MEIRSIINLWNWRFLELFPFRVVVKRGKEEIFKGRWRTLEECREDCFVFIRKLQSEIDVLSKILEIS